MQQRRLDNYLRSFRQKSGLSQEEISFLIGAKCGTGISRYERGRREPSFEALLAFEAIFGESARELFAGRWLKVESAVRERAEKLLREIASEKRNRAASFLAAITSRNQTT